MADVKHAAVKIEFTVQTVSRPHRVVLKRKVILPNWDVVESFKKQLLDDYARQFPGSEPLEIKDKFCSYK